MDEGTEHRGPVWVLSAPLGGQIRSGFDKELWFPVINTLDLYGTGWMLPVHLLHLCSTIITFMVALGLKYASITTFLYRG